MLNSLFTGVFDTGTQSAIGVGSFLLCLAVALLIGLFLAVVYGYRSRQSESFLTSLALLPAVVCVVIMTVNGNVGTGVAVAGAFSLVRFRSAPGNAREISAIFLAMGAGLMAGMGYLGYAVVFTLILGGVSCLYSMFWNRTKTEKLSLHVTIPEDLDYRDVFDDLFEQYTSSSELVNVKTTNMGSLFKLNYSIQMKPETSEKEFLDQLRCRNGNLEISLMKAENSLCEL